MAAAFLSASPAFAALISGQLLTNFASATMILSSGQAVSDFGPGDGNFSVPTSQTAWVLINDAPSVVSLYKFVTPPVTGAGGTLTYQVCIANAQDDTAWRVTITDRLAGNTVFINEGGPGAFDMTAPILGAPLTTFASTLGGAWVSGSPAVGQGVPIYLRWVFTGIGPHRSACVAYQARVL